MDDKLFIDTNILIYANNTASSQCQLVRTKLLQYQSSYIELWVSRQVIREYLTVMSRLFDQSKSLVTNEIISGLLTLTKSFRIADENDQVTKQLYQLLGEVDCGGKQVHDAAIVATMQVYEINRLMTFNESDFRRFTPQIEIVTV